MELGVRIIVIASTDCSNSCPLPPNGKCEISCASSSANVTHLASLCSFTQFFPGEAEEFNLTEFGRRYWHVWGHPSLFREQLPLRSTCFALVL